MSRLAYVRPVGRITRPPARINVSPDKVLRIGGREDLAFAGIELIQRQRDGWTDCRFSGRDIRLRVEATQDADWGIGEMRFDVKPGGRR